MTRPPAIALLFFGAALAFSLGPLLPRVGNEPLGVGSHQPTGPPAAERPQAAAPDFLPAYFALDPAAPVDAESVRAAFNPGDPYGGLPQTDGFDLVAAQCGACHSLNLVMQQRLTQERWDKLIDLMIAKHKMPAPDRETRAAIISYLARHFGW
jgi:mono/diheme cytochrome c family protein